MGVTRHQLFLDIRIPYGYGVGPVSFSLAKGGAVLLGGLSGSWKSTLVSYGAVGIGVDLCMLLLPEMEKILQAVLVGALVHLGKLLVK